MITEYKSALYRISYQGVSMIENALGNPNLIQISVVLGCSIIVSPQQGGGIQYLPNGESRKWFLYGVNTKLNKTGHHFIYARLNRDGDQAYLIFSVNDYAIDGTINGESPSPAYYYVKVGGITETDALEGATKQRKITFDYGKYQTDETREGNFWQLRADSQGNEYIITKYPVLTQGSLTQYATLDPVVPSIFEGIPYDNQTIWFNPATQRVEVIGGTGGGEAGSVKWVNITGKPTWIEDTKPSYSWSDITGEKPFYTKEEIASKYVTIDTEQDITALKHFTAGLSVGESKKKIYEENGVVYIDADVAVTGAMTFYATAGRTVSTIMDAVAVDGITIKKENNVLKAVSGAGSSFDENAMWSALSGSSDNQINKSHLTTALDGYATQNWVIENYATKSELSAVSNKLNDFLEGSDTDTIINKWKELEAFLSGMAETDNLAEILATKADRRYVDSTFVTLATKQTITGEKTFSSVLNTAAIKASGAITAPSLAVSDWVTIAGIKLRKLEDGALMLEGNLALTGALTMYASNGQSFDTIYDGLPIDNDTIYWQEVDGSRVLKAREGSGSSFDKSAMWTALAGSTTEQINKSHLTTALTGYATESWVSGKNYAVKATTLAGYGITDGINAVSVTGTGNAVTAASISGHTLTLTKGSTFSFSGHKHAWSDITSGKPTTLSGYGITDAYTKSEADSRYINASGDTMTGDLYFKNSSYPFFNKSNSYAFYNVAINLKSWSNNYFYPVKVTSNTPSFPLCTVSISSTSGGEALPLNNNSIRFMVRSGGWSDIGKRLIVLDHYAFSSSEITIYAIYLGAEDGDCVVYLRGGVNYTVSISGRDWVSSSDSMLTNGNEKYPKIDLSGNPTDGRSFAKCYRAWTHTDGYGVGLKAEYAESATRLQNARTIWGQSFDGTKNVSGALTSVTDITGTGTFTGANLKATDSVYVNGIRLHKTADGVITLEGNLAVTGGVTMYAVDPVSASTIMDGVVVDGTTIKKENGKLVAVGGGEAGSVAWGNISGKPSVFPTNIANITDLHSSWDAVLAAQKPAWLTAVSIATISDLHANWDALLKAAPSAYVTRWPTISEVTGKQNLIVKLNGGTTEGTNQFTYNVTGAKTINITPAGIGAAASSHNHSWSNITSGKPTTLAGYGITDAYTKTESDNRYLNVSGGDTIQGLITINHTTLDNSINIVREGSNSPTICFSNKTNGQLGRIGFNNEGKLCVYYKTSSDEGYVWHSTNDGAGSGLDADLLDGTHKSGLLTALTSSSGTNISITVGGTTKSIADLYANSAYKLENTHTIWGQNFNGTQNITGRLTSNERVYADKGIWVTNNDIAGWGQSNAALNLSIPSTSNTSGIICVYRSGQSNIGSTRFFSMEISNSSDSVRTYYANEVRINITSTYMDINKQLNINGNTIIGSGGNLGIGTANPAAKLHVIGDILATGGGTYYGSDIRYKSIMQQVNLSLLDIAKAPSFVYHWNRSNMNQNRLNLGGSAQYTQSILPWAVNDNDNFLSMDYATVAYTFAVHTARHLLTYESRTDKKIKKLEREIVILKKQLKKLGYEEVRTLDDQSV